MSLQGLLLFVAFRISFWARQIKHCIIWQAPAVPASELTIPCELPSTSRSSTGLIRAFLLPYFFPLLHLANSYLFSRLSSEKSSSRKDIVFHVSPLQVWVRSSLFAPDVCAYHCGGTYPPVVWFSGPGQKTNTSRCLSSIYPAQHSVHSRWLTMIWWMNKRTLFCWHRKPSVNLLTKHTLFSIT